MDGCFGTHVALECDRVIWPCLTRRDRVIWVTSTAALALVPSLEGRYTFSKPCVWGEARS